MTATAKNTKTTKDAKAGKPAAAKQEPKAKAGKETKAKDTATVAVVNVKPQTEEQTKGNEEATAKIAAAQEAIKAAKEEAARKIKEIREETAKKIQGIKESVKGLLPKGAKFGEKGPGVIAAIVEFLTAATEKQPLTKPALLDKLAERFPDRDRESMVKTISCQVPGRLQKEKGLAVHKNDNGYWAEPQTATGAK